jgi:hypothetical protein
MEVGKQKADHHQSQANQPTINHSKRKEREERKEKERKEKERERAERRAIDEIFVKERERL